MTSGFLIVEDEFLLRADAVEFMEEAGFRVYEAGNADEAIALLELHDDIRAVFTDIQMPGSMDGLKLAHYIRGRWPPVKLILTSGHAGPLLEDMPAGCGFFGKPYQLEMVESTLRSMLDKTANVRTNP
jgi:two-component system, response regulator PdtaR